MSSERDAVLAVLREAGDEALHWTVIWDRALRGGHVDPFTQSRDDFMRALHVLAASGEVQKTSTGTYRLPG